MTDADAEMIAELLERLCDHAFRYDNDATAEQVGLDAKDAMRIADALNALAKEAQAARAEAERLREALRPFARAAECLDAYDDKFPNDAAILRASADWFMRAHEKPDAETMSDLNKPLVAGDLRRARAALTQEQK